MVEILRSGQLLSRKMASEKGAIQTDIAPTTILEHDQRSLCYTRLYFRPRTPTQFHIQGIKPAAEFYYGKNAGVLAMMLFDAEGLLKVNSTKFSTGNLQSQESELLDGDSNFDKLEFDAIFHDSPQQDPEITRKRCAEILVESPLILADHLKYIVLRTAADVKMFKICLRENGLDHYSPLVRKSSDASIFFNQFTALDFIDTGPNIFRFKLKPAKSNPEVKVKFCVKKTSTDQIVIDWEGNLKTNVTYTVKHASANERCRVTIWLFDTLAHDSIFDL